MDALILIDLQNDFVPGGALAVADGDQVVSVANRLLGSFPLVVATQDWHPADHASFAANHPGAALGEQIELDGISQVLWPIHCVQGTPGAEFVSSLHTDRIAQVFQKGTNPRVDSYSGFFDNQRRRATGLAEYLRSRDVQTVSLLGLATDYCVKFTALDAVSLGFETRVVLDGCRGVELAPGDIESALNEMREAGVEIMDSQAVAH